MPAPLHIITLVKWVPDAQLERSFGEDLLLDRSEGILGELDEHPLEAALQIKEAASDRDVRITALTVGPDGASTALKKALQIGADDAVHLSDEALSGADLFATSRAAAAAVEHTFSEEPDAQHLVLTGMASEDGESGALPAQLAARLTASGAQAASSATGVVPAITMATDLSLKDESLRVTRVAGSRQQHLAAALPAVVSVTDQANEPRYPNFRAIMKAKKKKIATLSLTDLGLGAVAVESQVSLVSAEAREERDAGEIIHDDGQGGTRAVNFLAEEGLL